MKKKLGDIIRKVFGKDIEIFNILRARQSDNLFYNREYFSNSKSGIFTQFYSPFKISNSQIGDYTYIAKNSLIHNTIIGKFCSIGPNFITGRGLHPINGISTAPMFYSINNQNGMSLCSENKIKEHKPTIIGNDVFIGMNVIIIDGVTIGNGAVIGAGAVVSKDIPDYAVAVGNPIKVIKYRFSDETIKRLKKVKWWDLEFSNLKLVEEYFFEMDTFLDKVESKISE